MIDIQLNNKSGGTTIVVAPNLFQSILFLVLPIMTFGQKDQDLYPMAEMKWTTLFSSQESENVACYRIPALVTATNGTLIAAADERIPSCDDLRSNEDINIVIRTSRDNGKYWSQTQRIVDFPPGQSASDPSMIVDRYTKDILLFYNFMDLARSKGKYFHHMIRSKDHGLTWTEPEDITSQIIKEGWEKDFRFITSGRGFQTESGKLIHTLVNLDKGTYVFFSDDHGVSWQLAASAVYPADESKVVELSGGKWLINSRVQGAGHRVFHLSANQGRNWISWPEKMLPDPGCNASFIPYEKYDPPLLLFSNPADSLERKKLTVSYSRDEGHSWQVGPCIYPGSSAYSSMSELMNGEIGILFEKDDYNEIVFIRFHPEWITD